jgi:hypothetical protein
MINQTILVNKKYNLMGDAISEARLYLRLLDALVHQRAARAVQY